jgi:hypothetical protein
MPLAIMVVPFGFTLPLKPYHFLTDSGEIPMEILSFKMPVKKKRNDCPLAPGSFVV